MRECIGCYGPSCPFCHTQAEVKEYKDRQLEIKKAADLKVKKSRDRVLGGLLMAATATATVYFTVISQPDLSLPVSVLAKLGLCLGFAVGMRLFIGKSK
jgi:hypothetical protein